MFPGDRPSLFVLSETEDNIFNRLRLISFLGLLSTVGSFRARNKALDKHRVRNILVKVGDNLLEVSGVLLD